MEYDSIGFGEESRLYDLAKRKGVSLRQAIVAAGLADCWAAFALYALTSEQAGRVEAALNALPDAAEVKAN